PGRSAPSVKATAPSRPSTPVSPRPASTTGGVSSKPATESTAPRGESGWPSPRTPAKTDDAPMNGFEGLALANKDYVADQYRRWKDDPRSVDESWRLFFAGFELAADGGNGAGLLAEEGEAPQAPSAEGAAPAGPELGAFDLVHSYRELGHLVAY